MQHSRYLEINEDSVHLYMSIDLKALAPQASQDSKEGMENITVRRHFFFFPHQVFMRLVRIPSAQMMYLEAPLFCYSN